MGIFNFMADAGKKLLSREDDKPEAKSAEAIAAEIEALDLGNIGVEVVGKKVFLKGDAPSQEVREKMILAAGNINGIEEVEDDIAAGDDANEAKFHTVEKGDTLSKIAKTVYGNAMKYPVIFEANKPMLSDPDKIYPGQVLRIPALED